MLMTLLIGALGFVVIAGLGLAFAGGGSRDAVVKRTRAMAQGTTVERSKGALRKAAENTPEARRKQIIQQLKDVERSERRARVSLSAKIRQAGLSINVQTFYLLSVALGVVVALIAFLAQRPPLLALGLGFAFAFGVPRWVLGTLYKKRAGKFVAVFSDALDVIVRGIKSGLPLHDCLKIIGRESPAPVGPEFVRLVEGLGMGQTVDQGLERMYERLPTPELKYFGIVLNIQQKAGGNLAEALNNLSTVLRSRKMMREKIGALSGEAIASAGIIGALPPLLVVAISVMSPSYMSVMFTDQRGQMMLLVGVVWMGLGVLVMRKMIAFKF